MIRKQIEFHICFPLRICAEKSIFKLFLQIVKSSLVITPSDFIFAVARRRKKRSDKKEFSTFLISNICLDLLLTSSFTLKCRLNLLTFSFFLLLKVQKKRRIVARVQCRNIKNECPKPTCAEPILLPGTCCKTCPGDSHSKSQLTPP
jgi:hypothetical protein